MWMKLVRLGCNRINTLEAAMAELQGPPLECNNRSDIIFPRATVGPATATNGTTLDLLQHSNAAQVVLSYCT